MPALIQLVKGGLYCKQGDFYIDPWKAVDRALITHGHSDHARPASKYYLCHHHTVPILKARLGNNGNYEGIEFGVKRVINGVTVSFHPAGHIIGSAQIRVEYKGEVWVFSGDYKVDDDGVSGCCFEPVRCHTFITESTFGLPVYNWAPQEEIYTDINNWWRKNQANETTSVLFGYPLGKAQRLLANIDRNIGPVYLHGAVHNINQYLLQAGISIPDVPKVDLAQKKADFRNAMIIASPGAQGTPWMRRFLPYSTGMASGWMAVRGTRRWYSVDKGFALSDHADWKGLNETIRATGAEQVLVTHGYTAQFSQWLREQGYDSKALKTQFEDEPEEPLANESLVDGEAST